MQLLTVQHFAGCVNETFSAAIGGADVEFTLVEARPLPERRDSLRAPFVLLFRNTAAFLFPQQIYPMRHPRLGEVGIFVVPVAREPAGFLYEAVFN